MMIFIALIKEIESMIFKFIFHTLNWRLIFFIFLTSLGSTFLLWKLLVLHLTSENLVKIYTEYFIFNHHKNIFLRSLRCLLKKGLPCRFERALSFRPTVGHCDSASESFVDRIWRRNVARTFDSEESNVALSEAKNLWIKL